MIKGTTTLENYEGIAPFVEMTPPEADTIGRLVALAGVMPETIGLPDSFARTERPSQEFKPIRVEGTDAQIILNALDEAKDGRGVLHRNLSDSEIVPETLAAALEDIVIEPDEVAGETRVHSDQDTASSKQESISDFKPSKADQKIVAALRKTHTVGRLATRAVIRPVTRNRRYRNTPRHLAN